MPSAFKVMSISPTAAEAATTGIVAAKSARRGAGACGACRVYSHQPMPAMTNSTSRTRKGCRFFGTTFDAGAGSSSGSVLWKSVLVRSSITRRAIRLATVPINTRKARFFKPRQRLPSCPHNLPYIAESDITDVFPPHDKESMWVEPGSVTVSYYGRIGSRQAYQPCGSLPKRRQANRRHLTANRAAVVKPPNLIRTTLPRRSDLSSHGVDPNDPRR